MTSRWCIAALLAVQLAALLLATGAVGTVVPLAVAAGVAVAGLRLPMAGLLQRSPPYVILAIAMLAKFILAPYSISPRREFVNTPLTMELGTYCVLAQILILFGWPGRRLPMAVPFVAGVGLVSLFNVRIEAKTHWTADAILLLSLTVVAAVAVAVFFRRQRRRLPGRRLSRLPLLVALLLAGGFGVGSSLLLNRYESDLEALIIAAAGWEGGAGRVGPSEDGTLMNISSMRRDGDDRIALRVFAPPRTMPGYLRGRSYAVYRPRRGWKTDGRGNPEPPIPPPNDLPPFDHGQYVFPLPEPIPDGGAPLSQTLAIDEDDLRSEAIGERAAIEVWASKHMPAMFYIPPAASHIACETPTLSRDLQATAGRDKEDVTEPYTVFVRPSLVATRYAETTGELHPKRRSEYLAMPIEEPALESTVRGLARQIFAGADSVDDRIRAVESYFRANYRYELDGQAPSRRDMVEHFLSERDSGHCELFASASVLLLREAGIPARYATGVVVRERNEVGEYWVGRDRDAHAWCEAWDDDAGRWAIVESTPSAGVPQTQAESGLSELFDAIRQRLKSWQRALAARDVEDDLFAGVDFLTRTSTLLTTGLIAGVLALVLRLRRRSVETDPRLAALHRMRAAIERRLMRHGYVRRPSETVRGFARRLAESEHPPHREAAAWLESYARVRYRAEDSDELTTQHRALRRRLRGRPPKATTA